MFIYEIIAERRIREAMDRGEFDNLPGKGKPLPPDGLDAVPEDLRLSYKILKNAGILPEELELRKSINNLTDLLHACVSERERTILRTNLNEKQLRYRMLMEQRFRGTVDPFYHAKIMEKLGQ